MILVSVILSIITIICIAAIGYRNNSRLLKLEKSLSNQKPPDVNIDFNTERLEQIIRDQPSKILQSIVNSSNTHKGALGELIGYIELRAAYDRIIPISNICDFICIKLPSDIEEGCIDFVDIKTGHKARLSKDQRALRKLIEDKKINFCTIKIENVDKPE